MGRLRNGGFGAEECEKLTIEQCVDRSGFICCSTGAPANRLEAKLRIRGKLS